MTDQQTEARVYPCDRCRVLRSKAEGGTVFTVCDVYWDAAVAAVSPAAREAQATGSVSGVSDGESQSVLLALRQEVERLQGEKATYRELALERGRVIAERDAALASLRQTLAALEQGGHIQHTPTCATRHKGERWEPHYECHHGRWWGAWVPDVSVNPECTCGRDQILAALRAPDQTDEGSQ